MRGLGLDWDGSRKQLTGIFQGKACNHEWNHWCHHITWKLCFHYMIPLPGGQEWPQDACCCQHSPLPGLQGLLSSLNLLAMKCTLLQTSAFLKFIGVQLQLPTGYLFNEWWWIYVTFLYSVSFPSVKISITEGSMVHCRLRLNKVLLPNYAN